VTRRRSISSSSCSSAPRPAPARRCGPRSWRSSRTTSCSRSRATHWRSLIQEWLELVLFLVVAVVVGRLSASGAERGLEATRRAAVAGALFSISRRLAVEPNTTAAAGEIVGRLATDAALDRVTIVLSEGGHERVLADTEPGSPQPGASIVLGLMRMPGDQPARWVRSHDPRGRSSTARGTGTSGGAELLRVRIEAGDQPLGWLLATRRRASAPPDRDVTRVLALAADQVGLSLRRDQLVREQTEGEVARRSDALRSALLDSVTHDLRTPLASIRAAAGSLADPAQAWSDEARREAAAAIDAEAERLDRTVRGVLDLSRIEAGALQPEKEVFEIGEVAETVLDRWRPRLGERAIDVNLPADLPTVVADGRFLASRAAARISRAARERAAPIEGRRCDARPRPRSAHGRAGRGGG